MVRNVIVYCYPRQELHQFLSQVVEVLLSLVILFLFYIKRSCHDCDNQGPCTPCFLCHNRSNSCAGPLLIRKKSVASANNFRYYITSCWHIFNPMPLRKSACNILPTSNFCIALYDLNVVYRCLLQQLLHLQLRYE